MAWSTFATGVNPARHNMFDFLNRNLKTYLPELSSLARQRARTRVLKIGKYRIPLSRPIVEMRRKSRTFWQILGEHSIGSTILRVPITFPPEKFNGRLLSAMCTPDLLGTQGTFALYTTRPDGEYMEGGNRFPLAATAAAITARSTAPRILRRRAGPRCRSPSPSKRGDGRRHARIAGERYGSSRASTRLDHAHLQRVRSASRSAASRVSCSPKPRPQFSLYTPRSTSIRKIPPCRSPTPATTPTYLAKLLGAYRHARHGRGHLGAQRRRHR